MLDNIQQQIHKFQASSPGQLAGDDEDDVCLNYYRHGGRTSPPDGTRREIKLEAEEGPVIDAHAGIAPRTTEGAPVSQPLLDTIDEGEEELQEEGADCGNEGIGSMLGSLRKESEPKSSGRKRRLRACQRREPGNK